MDAASACHITGIHYKGIILFSSEVSCPKRRSLLAIVIAGWISGDVGSVHMAVENKFSASLCSQREANHFGDAAQRGTVTASERFAELLAFVADSLFSLLKGFKWGPASLGR
jgi:hypothetical protein